MTQRAPHIIRSTNTALSHPESEYTDIQTDTHTVQTDDYYNPWRRAALRVNITHFLVVAALPFVFVSCLDVACITTTTHKLAGDIIITREINELARMKSWVKC